MNLIAATDKKFAAVEIYSTVIQKITEKIENQYAEKDTEKQCSSRTEEKKVTSVLFKVANLQASCSKEVYKEKLNRLQKELERLHGELYRKYPVVIGFEGWDAGGKGGAIKRLTERMDPRGYVVNPISAPNDLENPITMPMEILASNAKIWTYCDFRSDLVRQSYGRADRRILYVTRMASCISGNK